MQRRDSDEDFDFPDDRLTGNSVASMGLPPQQSLAPSILALTDLADETLRELHVDGTNAADRTFSKDYGRDDDAFIPDFASEVSN
jgi:hypothetical protein